MNHDALFKSLLRTGRLLRDFFEVFLPRIHRFIDFDHIEFVDKERSTLEGKRRTGDLLIKTKFRGQDAAFLIHLEHEAQAHGDLARRMLDYFIIDWRDFDLNDSRFEIRDSTIPNFESRISNLESRVWRV